MRFFISLIAFFVIVSSLGAPAVAQTFYHTANELYRNCEPDEDDQTRLIKRVQCASYIMAVVDTARTAPLVSAAIGGHEPTLYLCIPPEVEVRQLVDIVVAYLRANPADRHLNASGQVQMALLKSYRCT